MNPDFVVQVKCTILWVNMGLRVYLDLYAPYFPKSMDLSASQQCVLFGCYVFEKSAAYKSKYTLKPLLSQNMVHFT